MGESGEEMRRETELMTKTLEKENIDNVQKRGRNGEKFNHTRNEEDKMADTSKEGRKPNWINNCIYCSTAHNKSTCPAYNKNCGKCSKHFTKCAYQKVL